ncbi:EpsG family protein [Sphingomonas sp. Leaf4]|uniref:EpsG family protein n=1 Tax=Sphingomonas sp. Leaf4 TaxID=2876553 RepID=UPI001E406EEB|nr:EpsG family protein [Sphingomonas sp. Leaf4]
MGIGTRMIVYWVMFGFPAAMALLERPEARRIGFAWGIVVLALVALIGLRWQTGGDWFNYERMVDHALWRPVPLSLVSDPGFTLLTGVAARSQLGMLLITCFSGVVMAVAVARFCFDQPRPWLCLSVAIPYLVVVMGMGYIRQGIAVSFLLLALASLRHGQVARYTLWVLAGAAFHSTALILLPLAVMVTNRNVVVRILLGFAVVALLGYSVASTRSDLVTNYVDAEMASSGAAIRLVMTALPGTLLLVFRERLTIVGPERSVWMALAGAAIAALVLLFVFPSSTVVDRLALYLLPIQCFVYARLPDAIAGSNKDRRLMVIAILALYAIAFFVWLNFAVNVEYWLPYRFYPLEDGICLEC